MINISTDSLFFALLLVIAPLLLRNNGKYRRYVFLAMNLMVFYLSMVDLSEAIVGTLWVLIPYLLAKRVCADGGKYRPALIAVMVAVFAYLMHYDAVFNTLHIPYAFPWRLLGLSYFLFRQIDYLMQYEYLESEGVPLGIVDYLNHILNFYTLLAGPIMQYMDFREDFYRPVSEPSKDEIFSHLNRALNGYLKVYVLSALAGHYAGKWFENLDGHSSVITTAGAFFVFAFLNSWYIYFNFSGYCDIVVSFAALSGLTVKENFNRPYLARSVAEFWNRHHISLSEWIRDYLYSPMFKAMLSGPFEGHAQAGQYLALFLTFTIAGIWHGTDMNYLVYGLFQGLGIVVATDFKSRRKKLLGKERNKAWEKNRLAAVAGRIVTWSYISLTFSFVGYDVVGWILSHIR